jgi:hypothetical protein
MYCGNYFYPHVMDIHVAECYRIYKQNQELAQKNMVLQQKSNKSHAEARRMGVIRKVY